MFYTALLKKLLSLGRGRRKRRAGVALRSRRLGQSLLRGESLEDRQMLSAVPTTTALLSHPTSAVYGQPVVLSAKVSTTPASARGSGPTGSVEFLDTLSGSTAAPTVLGTVNVAAWNSAAYLTLTTLPVGSDSITAIYTPPSGSTAFAGSTSTAVVESITPAASRTTVLATGNPIVSGTNTTFTAVVAGALPSVGGTTGATALSTGTVTFTIDAGTANAATVSGTPAGTSGGNALYQFTTSTPLTAGTHTLLATYSGDTDYNTSTSATISVQVVPELDGTVTVGSPATLRRGQQSVTVNVSEASGVASGTLSYSDGYRGISLSSVVVSNIVFDANGHEAEISGTAQNNGAAVAFEMIVSQGTGSRWSQSTVSVQIVGSGVDYLNTGLVASGSVVVTPSGTSTTTITPLGSGWSNWPFGGFQQAVQSFFSDFGSEMHGASEGHGGFGAGFRGHFGGGWRF